MANQPSTKKSYESAMNPSNNPKTVFQYLRNKNQLTILMNI